MAAVVKSLLKRPNESLLYNFDFVNLLATGETISSVTGITADTPAGATALTIAASGTWAISGSQVQARLSGGSDDALYHVTCKIATSDGNTREDCGLLYVAAC